MRMQSGDGRKKIRRHTPCDGTKFYIVGMILKQPIDSLHVSPCLFGQCRILVALDFVELERGSFREFHPVIGADAEMLALNRHYWPQSDRINPARARRNSPGRARKDVQDAFVLLVVMAARTDDLNSVVGAVP